MHENILGADSTFSKARLISHLHLGAVLPALTDLCAVSEEARTQVKLWHFPLCFSLRNGPATTLEPFGADGNLKISLQGRPTTRGLTLWFFDPNQLNRTFANQRALPPIPVGQVWLASKLKPFFALTRLLQRYLQPTEAELNGGSEVFRRDHLRLTFGVLVRAVRLVGMADPPSRDVLSHTPAGTVALEAPGLPAAAWLRWDGSGRLDGDLGAISSANGAQRRPDATLTFRDVETLADALHNRLDPMAAVGSGRVRIQGLVPLADALGFVMDRVEVYLRP